MGRTVSATAALFLALGVGLAAAGPADSDKKGEQQAVTASAPTAATSAPDVQTPSRSDAKVVVKERMMALGLTASEADAKVNALTQGDLQKLANNLNQVAMAGIQDRTLIIIAIILIVPSILLLMMI